MLGLSQVPVPSQIGGRLAYCLDNWKLLTQDSQVLQSVAGFHIPFVEAPVQSMEPPCYQQGGQEDTLIEEEIQSMLDKGAISMVQPVDRQFVSPLFLVPKKDGSQRPVINLKKLNQFVEYQHFKMEGLHLLKDLIQPGDFMIKVDLKDAYFSVPVCQEHQKFLRFRWQGKLYQFHCLPFGLGPAPRIFTKVMRPVIAFLRRLGVRVIVYLDDMIIMNQSREGLLKDRNSLLHLLMHLGFAINWKKSFLNPTQILDFLGFTVNTLSMTLALPIDKVDRITKKCRKLLTAHTVSVRELAEMVGLLTSSV